MPHKILIIEDEESLRNTLKLNLELEHYSVETCSNGKDAIEFIKSVKLDLILLDIMMPTISGIDVYKEIRSKGINTPIIFLTAKNNVQDKIEGLKLGADDYITKPFDLEEVLLRINLALKRNNVKSGLLDVFKFGDCEINFLTFQIIAIDGKQETLSKREMAFLKMLVDNINNVVSRDEILDKLWTKDESPSSRTIDNYILNFRKLFEINPKEPVHFLSLRGVGYKFCV